MVEIEIDKALRGRDKDGFIGTVETLNDRVDDWKKDFDAVAVYLEEGLSRVLDNRGDGANVAMRIIDDTEADDLVEIELIARERREHLEREIEFVTDEGEGLFGCNVVEMGDSLIAVDGGDMEEIGYERALDIDESRVEAGVKVGAVDIEKEDDVALEAERLGDFTEEETLILIHRERGVGEKKTSVPRQEETRLCKRGKNIGFRPR